MWFPAGALMLDCQTPADSTDLTELMELFRFARAEAVKALEEAGAYGAPGSAGAGGNPATGGGGGGDGGDGGGGGSLVDDGHNDDEDDVVFADAGASDDGGDDGDGGDGDNDQAAAADAADSNDDNSGAGGDPWSRVGGAAAPDLVARAKAGLSLARQRGLLHWLQSLRREFGVLFGDLRVPAAEQADLDREVAFACLRRIRTGWGILKFIRPTTHHSGFAAGVDRLRQLLEGEGNDGAFLARVPLLYPHPLAENLGALVVVRDAPPGMRLRAFSAFWRQDVAAEAAGPARSLGVRVMDALEEVDADAAARSLPLLSRDEAARAREDLRGVQQQVSDALWVAASMNRVPGLHVKFGHNSPNNFSCSAIPRPGAAADSRPASRPVAMFSQAGGVLLSAAHRFAAPIVYRGGRYVPSSAEQTNANAFARVYDLALRQDPLEHVPAALAER